MIGALTVALKIGLRRRTLSISQFIKFSNVASTMSIHSSKSGMSLCKVVDALHSFADPSLSASWDNVGLLIEPTEEKCVSRILLTNDLTEDVMQEAIDSKADMIVAYHPPIFNPLKSVTNKTWKERIIAKCLENRIALYSPHTSFDAVKGGTSDWLASAFDAVESVPIENSIKNESGAGRISTLKNPISIEEAVQCVKKHTNLSYVRLAKTRNQNSIKIVASCPGSGTSVLKGVQADLYLTGEMFHHDVLEAVHNGISVILTNHSDSERGFLKEFAKIFTECLDNQVIVDVSKTDTDPLKTV